MKVTKLDVVPSLENGELLLLFFNDGILVYTSSLPDLVNDMLIYYENSDFDDSKRKQMNDIVSNIEKLAVKSRYRFLDTCLNKRK